MDSISDLSHRISNIISQLDYPEQVKDAALSELYRTRDLQRATELAKEEAVGLRISSGSSKRKLYRFADGANARADHADSGTDTRADHRAAERHAAIHRRSALLQRSEKKRGG